MPHSLTPAVRGRVLAVVLASWAAPVMAQAPSLPSLYGNGFRTAPDTLTYRATVEDPNTWTSAWTVEVPLSTQPGYQVFPYECHEGNHALRNMLSEILPRDPSSGRPQ